MAACHCAWGGHSKSSPGRGWGFCPRNLTGSTRKKSFSETGGQRCPGREGSRVKSWGLAISLRGGGQGDIPPVPGCSWGFCGSGETNSLSTAPVVTQLEAGHFFDASITKQHLFASVHDAVIFALQHQRSSPVNPVLVS